MAGRDQFLDGFGGGRHPCFARAGFCRYAYAHSVSSAIPVRGSSMTGTTTRDRALFQAAGVL